MVRKVFGPAMKQQHSGAQGVMRSVIVCIYHVLSGLRNQGELGRWAYGAYGGDEKCMLGFGEETCRVFVDT